MNYYKKLTDKQIREALEYCTADRNECDKCVLQKECESNPFYSAVANAALDLVNRQKVEIERLKECPKCVYEYDGEMTEYCVQGPCSNFKTVEQIKAEAYKEFVERLKSYLLLNKKGEVSVISFENIDSFYGLLQDD